MNPEILKFSRWLHLRDAVLKAESELANLRERFERATDDLAGIIAPPAPHEPGSILRACLAEMSPDRPTTKPVERQP